MCPGLERLVGLAVQLEVGVVALVLRGLGSLRAVVPAVELEVALVALVLRGLGSLRLVMPAMRLDVVGLALVLRGALVGLSRWCLRCPSTSSCSVRLSCSSTGILLVDLAVKP
jgi:hypothetical protein